MTLKDKFVLLKQQIKQARATAVAISKQVFADEIAEVFAANPELHSFSWTQYTPYFNDGDPCVFRAHSGYINLKMAGAPVEDEDWDEEEEFSDCGLKEGDWGNRTDIPDSRLTPKQKAGKAALAVLSCFDNEDLEFMFGDHARVIVSRNGISVEEYSHD